MKFQTMRMAAVAAVFSTLAACGGSGGGESGSTTPGGGGVEMPTSPTVASFGALAGRTDTLLFSAVHSRWSGTVDGETVEVASANR